MFNMYPQPMQFGAATDTPVETSADTPMAKLLRLKAKSPEEIALMSNQLALVQPPPPMLDDQSMPGAAPPGEQPPPAATPYSGMLSAAQYATLAQRKPNQYPTAPQVKHGSPNVQVTNFTAGPTRQNVPSFAQILGG